MGWDAVGSRIRLNKGGGGGRYPCCLHSTQCHRPVAAGDGSVPCRTTGEATCRYPLCPFVFCGFRFWEGRGTLDSDVHTPHHLEPASRTCPFLHYHQVSRRKRAVREKGALDIILFSPVDPPPKCWGRFSSRPVPTPLPFTDNSPTWRLCTVSRLLQQAGRLSCSASPMRRHMPSILVPTLRPRRSTRGTLIRRTVDSECCPILGIPARTSSTAIG